MSNPIESHVANGGEGHLSTAIVDQASEWMVKVWSGTATLEDLQACESWRAAHADHERVWQRLQALAQKLEIVPHSVARKTLGSASISTSRRRTLKGLAVLLTTGSAATYAIGRTIAWQYYVADHRTNTGEVRTIILVDLTQVTLNTASAIDVQFDAQRRQVELRSGEIMVNTSPDSAAAPRPFIVATAHGTVRALGTRFTVRRTDDNLTHVAVFEGAVLIQPSHSTDQPLQLDAGQQASFSDVTGQDVVPADESASAWVHGSLMVERMRLDAFIEELSRYRHGVLRCDPSVGHYVLTGVYPLVNTDRILASIEAALPIKVTYRNRYWVTVTKRNSSS